MLRIPVRILGVQREGFTCVRANGEFDREHHRTGSAEEMRKSSRSIIVFLWENVIIITRYQFFAGASGRMSGCCSCPVPTNMNAL